MGFAVEVEVARFSPPAHSQGRIGHDFLVQLLHLEHLPFLQTQICLPFFPTRLEHLPFLLAVGAAVAFTMFLLMAKLSSRLGAVGVDIEVVVGRK